ncbi:hypothetical protein H0H93_006582 [Arthromyces matolae]|nr:hypothetical protein H0H93_006582 [Arthromyces matolae]
MSSALDAVEKLKLALLNMHDACQASEVREHEELIEKEKRSLAKDARFDALFRDLKYIEQGLQDIKDNQVEMYNGTGQEH